MQITQLIGTIASVSLLAISTALPVQADSVVAWGTSYSGELGNGSDGISNVPVPVKDPPARDSSAA